MQVIGNMAVEQHLDADKVLVRCHCDHNFRAAVNTKKIVIPNDGAILTPSGGEISCPKCGCVWRKTKRELPEDVKLQYFAFYVRAIIEPSRELLFTFGYAYSHTHFIADHVLPVMAQLHTEKLKEYRVATLTIREYDYLLDEKKFNEERRGTKIMSRFLEDFLNG